MEVGPTWRPSCNCLPQQPEDQREEGRGWWFMPKVTSRAGAGAGQGWEGTLVSLILGR